MNRRLLSIIIVNYNGEKFLNSCLHSVVEHCNNLDYEIILVDNNSTDSSLTGVEDISKSIKIVKNATNLGFAAGNNIGVKHSTGDFILLLNNDTILLEPISPAIELIRDDTSIGIVGIKMLDEQNRFVASFGKFPKFYNFIKLKTLQIDLVKIEHKIFQAPHKPIDVDWISGAFLITTKEIWQQVNGLDESFFMYVEDVDFNKKVLELNKKRVFLPSLSFIHFVGFNKSREKLLISSYKTYIRNHKKGIDLMASLLMLNINLFFKIILNRV